MEPTNYPYQIESEAIKLHDLSIELTDLQFEAGQIADATVADVATNPDYKNDTVRKAEIKLRLATNETYQRLDRLIRDTETRRAHSAARLERLRGDFAVWKLEQRAAIAAAELVAA